MRNPLPPGPGINLGDDPDPASDLGQRLASTAQTAQGLLTNYLFYGQRRQAEHGDAERGHRRGGVDADGRSETTRRTRDTHASDAAAAQPERLPQAREPSPRAAPPAQPQAPRLHLRLVHSDEHHASTDPLARDALAEPPPRDPLRRDGLAEGTEQHPTPGAPDLSHDPGEQR